MAATHFTTGHTTMAGLVAALAQAPSVAADRLYVPPGEGQALVRRLLVLVPQAAGLDAELAQRAWRLAWPARLPVVLVGLAHDSASEAQRRRQLASLAALTRGEGVPVKTSLSLEVSWLAAVRSLWRPGDLVVCFAGQMAPAGWLGLGRQPLHQALQAGLRAPFYQARLSDEAPGGRRGISPLTQALALLGALGFIVFFFWLQVMVTQLAHGFAQSGLLLVSVVFEFGLIWLVGKLLAQG